MQTSKQRVPTELAQVVTHCRRKPQCAPVARDGILRISEGLPFPEPRVVRPPRLCRMQGAKIEETGCEEPGCEEPRWPTLRMAHSEDGDVVVVSDAAGLLVLLRSAGLTAICEAGMESDRARAASSS